MGHTLAELWSGPRWKQFLAAIGAICGWMYPQEALRMAVGVSIVLLLFDLVLGIYHSVGIEGEALESRKFVRSAMKMFVYVALPAMTLRAVLVLGATKDVAIATAAGLATLAVLTEFLSICRHINATKLLPIPAWLVEWLEDRASDIVKPKGDVTKAP